MTVPSSPIPTGTPVIKDPTTLTMFWYAPEFNGGSPITDYKVKLIAENGVSTELFYPSTILVAVCENLQNNCQYTITVEASNDNRISWSAPATFNNCHTIPLPTEAPINPSVILTDTTAIVSWSPPSIVPFTYKGRYRVCPISSNPNDILTCFLTNSLNETTITINLSELDIASTYYFSISLLNEVGESPAVITG
jgi:hypothetical protein